MMMVCHKFLCCWPLYLFFFYIIETEGVALNSLSRAELMAKLAARDPNAEQAAPAPVAAAPIAP